MTIVTYRHRPKGAPRKKRKQSEIANRIVTPPKLKPIKGPVIRLHEQANPGNSEPQAKRSAIVEPKRKRASIFGDAPEMTAEDHQRAGQAADALWRELVRRLPAGKHE